MKIMLIVMAILLLGSCSDTPTANNPYDPNYDLPEPYNIDAELLSDGNIELNWEYENINIEGFAIKRRVGTIWQDEYQIVSPDIRSWTDENVPAGEFVQYRIAAFAGDNFSDYIPSITISTACNENN